MALDRHLVTGGAGFVGSHLVRALLEEGHPVRVLDDVSTGRVSNLEGLPTDEILVWGDVRDPATCRRALDGVEVCHHLAAIPAVPRSLAEPARTTDVNVGGTVTLLEEARKAGIRRVVLASSSSVYGEGAELPRTETAPTAPTSPYGLQKEMAERFARLWTRHHGLETVSLRYFNVYGPRQDPESAYAAVVPAFIRALRDGEPPTIHGDGHQTRDFTWVGDVCRAHLLAAEAEGAPGEVLNVAAGRPVSILELAEMLIERTGADVEPRHGPARPGDVRHSEADVARALEVLDWSPEVDLEEGLDRTLAWFEED